MVVTFPVRGYFEENTFFYIDEKTRHGLLIDPGAEAERLLARIRREGWTIEKILLTHGHFDHIGAAEEVREALGAPIYASARVEDYLMNPSWNLSTYFGTPSTLEGTMPLRDGDEIALDADPTVAFRVIETPGHTTDSLVFYCERDGLAFTGDTIFRGTVGNDRLPGGDWGTMIRSILDRVLTLPPETALYSGHTDSTTVGEERPHFAPWGGRISAMR